MIKKRNRKVNPFSLNFCFPEVMNQNSCQLKLHLYFYNLETPWEFYETLSISAMKGGGQKMPTLIISHLLS